MAWAALIPVVIQAIQAAQEAKKEPNIPGATRDQKLAISNLSALSDMMSQTGGMGETTRSVAMEEVNNMAAQNIAALQNAAAKGAGSMSQALVLRMVREMSMMNQKAIAEASDRLTVQSIQASIQKLATAADIEKNVLSGETQIASIEQSKEISKAQFHQQAMENYNKLFGAVGRLAAKTYANNSGGGSKEQTPAEPEQTSTETKEA